MEPIIHSCGAFLRDHLAGISTAWLASLLVIYGNEINSAVKKQIKSMAFPLRLLIFVLVSAVGYGLLTVYGSQTIALLLHRLDDKLLITIIPLAFLLIGFLAEKKRQL